MPDKITVGIDLGTSSCSVGIIRKGQLTIFKDGNDTTPYYVAYTESGLLIGHEAKNHRSINIFHGIKRLIGKDHNQVMKEREKLGLPLKISPAENNNSYINIECKGKYETFYPKQVYKIFLSKMKEIAEKNLREVVVHGAVISVPANFNSYQRQATIDAALLAGFIEVNLIDEPTASAIALSSQQNRGQDRNILIADFGGGFFSVTAARVGYRRVDILESCVEDFGGLDLNQKDFTEKGEKLHQKVKKKFLNSKHLGQLKSSGGDKLKFDDIVLAGRCWNHSFRENFLSTFEERSSQPYHGTNPFLVLQGAALKAGGITNTYHLTVNDDIRIVTVDGFPCIFPNSTYHKKQHEERFKKKSNLILTEAVDKFLDKQGIISGNLLPSPSADSAYYTYIIFVDENGIVKYNGSSKRLEPCNFAPQDEKMHDLKIDKRKQEPRKVQTTIGIDLGTSKCCVGIFSNGKVQIIENERAKKTTPSCLAFTDVKTLIGHEAKMQAVKNLTSTISGFKKLVGENRNHDDRYFSAKVCDVNGIPAFSVGYKKSEIKIYPEQLTAMMIRYMKFLAENHLEDRVKAAVLSVPAYFTNAQRQAVKTAADIAGVKLLAIIDETTAIAIAYWDKNKGISDETNLIVDFGAGGISASFVSFKRHEIEVLATAGDGELGGRYIDWNLMEMLKEKIPNEHKQNVSDSPKATERLRASCEKLKKDLSILKEAHVQIDNLDGVYDLDTTISIEEYERKCSPVVQDKLRDLLEELNKVSKKKQFNINKVILAGESARVPFVEELLKKVPFVEELLKKKINVGKINKTVHADDAVARGNTLLGALLSSNNELEDFDVIERLKYKHPKSGRTEWCNFIPGEAKFITKETYIDRYGIITLDGESSIDVGKAKEEVDIFEHEANDCKLFTEVCNKLISDCKAFNEIATKFSKDLKNEKLINHCKGIIQLLEE